MMLRRFRDEKARINVYLLVLLIASGAIYCWDLGRASLDDAEAYSAYIASRPTVAAVLDANVTFDPGKPGLYPLMLHYYCRAFGTGEVALRAFSAAFALVSVVLVFCLAAKLFDDEAALAAAAIWAFNPVLLVLARWARMYSMFIALALASLLALRMVQEKPNVQRVVMFGLLGAAMLYTHLGAVCILGAEAALLVRDYWRGRSVFAGFLGLLITVILFAPVAMLSFDQLHASVTSQRFAWIGQAIELPLAIKAVIGLAAMAAGLVLVFGLPLSFDRPGAPAGENPEPMRWSAIWVLLPLIALFAGSILVRPMFKLRYLAPMVAGIAILAAAAFNFAGAKIRNLATTAIAGAFVAGLIFSQTIFARPPFTTWRDIANKVAVARSSAEPVFFEAGYVMRRAQAAGHDPDSLTEVLPDGFLRVPFDYYFAGENPRRAINPFKPEEAREIIAEAARSTGGAWLVTHLDDGEAIAQLPANDRFWVSRVLSDGSVALYHVVPRTNQIDK